MSAVSFKANTSTPQCFYGFKTGWSAAAGGQAIEDLRGNRIRITTRGEMNGSKCGPSDPQSVRYQWVTAGEARVPSVGYDTPISYDTGLIDARGGVCVIVATNIDVNVTLEMYVPEATCVPIGTTPKESVSGGIQLQSNCGGGVSLDPGPGYCGGTVGASHTVTKHCVAVGQSVSACPLPKCHAYLCTERDKKLCPDDNTPLPGYCICEK